MQYGNVAEATIVRSDDSPDRPDASRHHERRTDGSVKDVDVDGLRALFEQFRSAVTERGHDR